jgi:SulP family sulfate permease
LTVVVNRPARRSSGAALLPIVRWLPSYERKWLRGDIAAGIAVTALIVPKDLGYAGIAGVPLQNGLYAAAAGAIIYALFCTSRQISTGPSSSLAAVAGGAVVVAGLADDQAAELVAAIALITGLLFLVLAFLRLGWISRFLSKAVITGFLAGAAVDVVFGELPKLTGTDAEGENAWRELGSWIVSLADVHWPTVVVGVLALGLILAVRFLAPAVPGALLLVVAGILAARLFDLEEYGVALVGHVPNGLPTPQLPDLGLITDNLATVVVAAVALVLIGFSQTAGDARMFAARHRYRIDIDQESVAQGMANAGAGVFQGMPVSTSLSASSLNESAGAKTPMASLITGGLVILTLLFLAPLFSDLPQAVLGAVIIDAVVFGMIDLPELRRLHRVTRFDFWIAVAAIVGVLSSGVLAGVVIGVVLSLCWLIHVATAPPMPLLGREPGTQVFRDLDENPGDETFPGVVVLRFDSGLFFATAQALEDRVRELAEAGPATLRALVLDFEGVNFIDSQGAEQLAAIHELMESNEATLRLARMKPNVLAVLRADGFVDRLGTDHIHGNVHRAVEAQLRDDTRGDDGAPVAHRASRATNGRDAGEGASEDR